MFAPNPGVLAAGVSTLKTYAEFDAHVKAQPGIVSLGWTSTAAKTAGTYYTNGTTTAGTMQGTTWGRSALSTSRTSRLVQHAVNSFAHYEEVRLNDRVVFLRMTTNTGTSLGLDRNNFLSADMTVSANRVQIDEIWYWIDGIGPLKGDPRNSVLATPFDW